MQGAENFTIVRPCNGYFAIINIAAKLTEYQKAKLFQLSLESVVRSLLLIWNWEKLSEESQGSGEYVAISSLPKSELEARLAQPTRTWNVALALGDVGLYSAATEGLRKSIAAYKKVLGEPHPQATESEYGITPLGLAARNGYIELVRLLLAKDGIDPDLEDWYGRTPLSHASETGHKAIVELLLETGRININSRDMNHRTPLFYAAVCEHEAVVNLILQCSAAVEQQDIFRQTPLSYATWLGHDAVTKLLLQGTDAGLNKADMDFLGCTNGQERFYVYPWDGHAGVVNLALKMGSEAPHRLNQASGKFLNKSLNRYDALNLAAENGLEVVVKMLLHGRVDNLHLEAPLERAVENGHEAVVYLMLETGIDCDKAEPFWLDPAACGLEEGAQCSSKSTG